MQRVPILVTDNGSNFLSRRFRAHIDGVVPVEGGDPVTPADVYCCGVEV